MAWKRTLKDGTVRWQDKVYIKTDTPDGPKRTTKTIWAPTRKECLALKVKALEQRDKPVRSSKAKPKMKLAELGEKVSTQHFDVKERSTRQYYKTALRYRIAPYLYEYRITTIDREVIADWISTLKAEQKLDRETKKMVPAHSPRSINAALSTLKVILAKGVEWGYLETNVAYKYPKLPEQKSEIRIYSPEDVENLCMGVASLREELAEHHWKQWAKFAQLAAIRDMAMVATMSFTGVRLGELLGLKWDDVGDDGWLRVERQVDSRTGKEKQTKTFQSRTVPILEGTRNVLEWWRAANPPASKHAYVFPSLRLRNAPLMQNPWRERVFKPGASKAGFPKAKPHELRHTFASLMIARGVTPLRLAKWMGHSDPMTTMRIYAHLFDRLEGDDLIAKVNQEMFS